MLPVGTEEIAYFGSVILGISDLRSYSVSRRTWTPATLSDSKVPGSNGSTRASRTVSTTTRRANQSFERIAKSTAPAQFHRSATKTSIFGPKAGIDLTEK